MVPGRQVRRAPHSNSLTKGIVVTFAFEKIGRAWPYGLVFLLGAITSRLSPENVAGIGSAFNGVPSAIASATGLLSSFSTEIAAAAAIAAALFLLRQLYLYAASRVREASPASKLGNVTSAPRAKVLDAVSENLEKQISALVGIATAHLESSNVRAEAYAQARAGLGSADTAEKVHAIVEVLVSTSSLAQSEAEHLRTELKAARAQVTDIRLQLVATEKIAQLDGLTGLPNRRHFEAALKSAVADAHESVMPMCLVMADIDHFKKVNDTHGHPTGDEILKQFGKFLANNVRSSDIVARYGGEEFALILQKTPTGSAVEVVERLRRNIQATHWMSAGGKDIGTVTASFGLAEIKDAEGAGALVERADRKLYAAKRNGRNRVEFDASRE